MYSYLSHTDFILNKTRLMKSIEDLPVYRTGQVLLISDFTADDLVDFVLIHSRMGGVDLSIDYQRVYRSLAIEVPEKRDRLYDMVFVLSSHLSYRNENVDSPSNNIERVIKSYYPESAVFYFFPNTLIGLEEDKGLWSKFEIPYSMTSMVEYAIKVSSFVTSFFMGDTKLLALDADGVLWDGVAGEKDFNLSSQRKGLIHTLVSKAKESRAKVVLLSANTDHSINEGIGKLGLEEDVFEVIETECKDKGLKLSEILKSKDIAPEFALYIDDDPMELKRVCDVTGVEAFECNSYSDIKKIMDRAYFQGSKTDALKVPVVPKTNESYEEFLSSLNLKLKMVYENHDAKRLLELFRRTTRFNATGMLYSQFTKDKENHYVISAEVSDIYGSYGVCFGALVHLDGDVLNIRNLVVSCRILNRRLESTFLDNVIGHFKDKGIKSVMVEFVETNRNSLVREFLFMYDFSLIEDSSDVWVYKLEL